MDIYASLRCVDPSRQPSVDRRPSARLRWGMAHPEEDRKALGKRLAAARGLAGYTMEAAAKALTELGYPISKQGVGAWEAGRNIPDAFWLRRLAKLYRTTVDSLVWDDALTIEAVQFAAQFDALNDKQQRAFRAMWLAYFEQAKTDEEVEEHYPPAPASSQFSVVPQPAADDIDHSQHEYAPGVKSSKRKRHA